MRVEASHGPGGGDSHASDLLRSVTSGDTSVNQDTREALQRLLLGETAPAPAKDAPASTPVPAPAKSVTAGSPEALRRAGLDYVRKLRIYAR